MHALLESEGLTEEELEKLQELLDKKRAEQKAELNIRKNGHGHWKSFLCHFLQNHRTV